MLMEMDGQQQGLHGDWTRGVMTLPSAMESKLDVVKIIPMGNAIFTFKLVISTVAGPEQQVPVRPADTLNDRLIRPSSIVRHLSTVMA